MSIPNLDTKPKILVMDSKNRITQEISDMLENDFELTKAGSFEGIMRMLSLNPLPWYSLIIFDSSQLLGISNLELKIMDIREEDQLVPLMVYGKKNAGIVSEVARGCGCFGAPISIYAAENMMELQKELGLIFPPEIILPNLIVAKLGGSSFDYVGQCKKRSINRYLKEECKKNRLR